MEVSKCKTNKKNQNTKQIQCGPDTKRAYFNDKKNHVNNKMNYTRTLRNWSGIIILKKEKVN